MKHPQHSNISSWRFSQGAAVDGQGGSCIPSGHQLMENLPTRPTERWAPTHPHEPLQHPRFSISFHVCQPFLSRHYCLSSFSFSLAMPPSPSLPLHLSLCLSFFISFSLGKCCVLLPPLGIRLKRPECGAVWLSSCPRGAHNPLHVLRLWRKAAIELWRLVDSSCNDNHFDQKKAD